MTLFAEHTPKPAKAAPVAGLTIREAREADLQGVTEIAAEREGKEPGRLREGFEKLLRETAPAGDGLLLVAEVGGVVIAFGKVMRFCHDPVGGAPAGLAPPVVHASAGPGSSGLNSPDLAPEGWYLSGVIVRPEWRRRGVGDQLTWARLEWISRRAERAYYFVNARNTVSIVLHRRFGFVEMTRRFSFPGTSFVGGEGVLFAAELRRGGVAEAATCSGAS
jgi:ribosomal protein S18 acetylase RimI-like enzyme